MANVIAGTLPKLTCAFSGAAILSGVLPKLTCAFRGPAVLGGVLPKITGAFSNQTTSFTLTGTLPKLTGAFWSPNGTVIDATLPAFTASFTGRLTTIAALAGAAPSFTASFSGGAYKFSPSLPAITAAFVGLPGLAARINAQAPRLLVNFSSTLTISAALAGAAPAVACDIDALVGSKAALAGRTRKLSAALSGGVGTRAALAGKLPVVDATYAAYQGISALVAVIMPRLQGAFVGRRTPTQVLTLVLNTITNSTVMYEAYPYNSFAEINGLYYAAGPEGLYQIEIGGLDTLAQIDAHIAFGQTKFYSEKQKRMSDFYVGMRSEGNITLSVSVDERDPYDYTLDPHAIATLKQRRSLIGKGLKGKYWQFRLANTGGCDFDFDTMNATAVTLERRI